MENGNTIVISVKKMLEMTADELDQIMIPVSMANDIARPIWQAVKNIRMCANTMKDDEEPKTETPEEVNSDGEGDGV